MEKLRPVTIERDDSRVAGTTLGHALHGTVRVEADGRTIAILRYDHGVLSGAATYFNAEGTPSAEVHHRNGKLDGKARFYYPTGSMQREAHYALGQLHGSCRTWLMDGTLLEDAHYRHGKLHGLFQRFHPNGRLALRQPYAAGKPLEQAESYSNEGRMLGEDGKPVPRWKQWWNGQTPHAPLAAQESA
ncbi:toxin-antitoxin system YwqK family antitoxin [Paraburkholderia bannensis]|uniref:toxin-antitoxin system YwqK family antitoxin n=1 Tax=Paraburkholderia bannensis TaxID=765414 RepID=UPI002AB74718|nr:hypothetical protein [Paraburkholderia bannensis]